MPDETENTETTEALKEDTNLQDPAGNLLVDEDEGTGAGEGTGEGEGTGAGEEEVPESDESANIIFIRKELVKDELVVSTPPKSLVDGDKKFKLPSAETQIAGFYHPEADRIVRAFPKLYKPIVQKGS